MVKKLSLFICATFTFTAIAATRPQCPSAQEMHEAVYRTYFAPNFFEYALNGNFVTVSIPPSMPETKAEADKILWSVSAAYPLEQSGPCFYAPYAKLPNANVVFVMWSDQPPPS